VERGVSEGGLGADVLALLRERVRGFEALEILLKLYADRREWSANEIDELLGIDRDLARDELDALASAGLLAARGSGRDRRWRFAPEDAAVESAAVALVEAYGTSRLEVMHRMTENALERIRSSAVMTFADAFKLTKGKRDG
jgi:hypothetical protein